MKTEICFDCYKIMVRKEEGINDSHNVFWICESCGKRKYDDQIKIN